MHIYVNNKLAALKKGTSFEFVSENRMFSGSDGYTLTITFPLKGCPENIAIFGHINRADVVAQKVIFDCEIRDRGFYKFGSITITEISETEVKTQFLEGRSEQNFDKTFDKVYINELDLGAPPTTSKSSIMPSRAWYPETYGCKYVALPWVNDYSGNIQNKAEHIVDDAVNNRSHFEWSNETTGLSWQPYLLHITRKICEAVGYTADFSKWEEVEEYKYLLICNTLPHAWYMPGFANALPHWTVEEYFEKLELFLGGEFDFDHRGKRITFAFTQATLASKSDVCLENVVEEHSTEVKVDEDRCEYLEAKNLVYKDCDHEMWKFYSCDWFIKGWQNRVVRYNSMTELLNANKTYRNWDGQHHRDNRIDKILYAADCDAYFIIVPLSRQVVDIRLIGSRARIYFNYKCRLQPINLFGGRIVNDDEEAEQVEIEFVPAWIDDTEDKYGRVLFLSFSAYDEDSSVSGEDESKYPFQKTHSLSSLEAGEKEKKAEYYDRIYVGWYDGANHFIGNHLPYPNVEDIAIADDWSNFAYVHFSMRINDRKLRRGQIIHNIEPKMKTTFKFLADNIPDVRSVFLIRGKRYICEKITATFTENGMSQLLKGVFYPIVED